MTETIERTVESIQQEYWNKAAAYGNLHYQIAIKKEEIEKLGNEIHKAEKELRALNEEGFKLQRKQEKFGNKEEGKTNAA